MCDRNISSVNPSIDAAVLWLWAGCGLALIHYYCTDIHYERWKLSYALRRSYQLNLTSMHTYRNTFFVLREVGGSISNQLGLPLCHWAKQIRQDVFLVVEGEVAHTEKCIITIGWRFCLSSITFRLLLFPWARHLIHLCDCIYIYNE